MGKSFLRREYTEGIVLQADKDVFGVRCVSGKCYVGNTRLEPKGSVRSGDSSNEGLCLFGSQRWPFLISQTTA